jgi:hypothetical protein
MKSRKGSEILRIETIRMWRVIFQKTCELDIKRSKTREFNVKYGNFSTNHIGWLLSARSDTLTASVLL